MRVNRKWGQESKNLSQEARVKQRDHFGDYLKQTREAMIVAFMTVETGKVLWNNQIQRYFKGKAELFMNRYDMSNQNSSLWIGNRWLIKSTKLNNNRKVQIQQGWTPSTEMRIWVKARNEEGVGIEWNKDKKMKKSNFRVKNSLILNLGGYKSYVPKIKKTTDYNCRTSSPPLLYKRYKYLITSLEGWPQNSGLIPALLTKLAYKEWLCNPQAKWLSLTYSSLFGFQNWLL